MENSRDVDIITAQRVHHNVLIRTSIGAAHIDSRFLLWKSRGEPVTSARQPKVKVKVARVRPMMVRYW